MTGISLLLYCQQTSLLTMMLNPGWLCCLSTRLDMVILFRDAMAMVNFLKVHCGNI